MELKEALLELRIPQQQAEKMAAYGALLEEANKSFNLTRITSPEDMAEKHFYDSLAPVRLGLVREGQRVLDIGTGAGFPGVPLAIPAVCIWGRAEELAAHINQGRPIGLQDAVVARAVARLAVLLELGSAFVKKGGLFLAYKGEAAQEEADEAQNAAKVLGLRLREIVPAGLPGRAHSLVVYEKVADTPKGYPRKFAKIKARPL